MPTFDIEKTPTFDIEATLECGQVFRYRRTDEGFRVYALSHAATISDLGDRYRIACDDVDFFNKYFDFDTDYAFIQSKVEDKGLVSQAIEFGRGIHILRQDPYEAVFSFIISQTTISRA